MSTTRSGVPRPFETHGPFSLAMPDHRRVGPAVRHGAAFGLSLWLYLCCWAMPGSAHQGTGTFGEVTRIVVPPGAVRHAFAISWRLRVAAVDLMSALALSSPGAFATTASRGRSPGECLPWGGTARVQRRVRVHFRTLLADPGSTAAELTLIFEQRFVCARAESVRLRYDLLFEVDAAHESFTRLALGDPSPGAAGPDNRAVDTGVFRNDSREVTAIVGRPRPVWRSALLYLGLGIEHILSGYDHLSFLTALLLAAGLRQPTTVTGAVVLATLREAARAAVTIISAFTVAHSLTLISQVLHPAWVPRRWVEPAIAFSVVYVGIENLIARHLRHRWLLVFGFGLVHGLGFASVLREIGLPDRGLLLCLVSFNAGVELGQFLVLTLALPLIVAAARRAPRRFRRWGLQVGSSVIACFGLIWLVARLAAR